MGTHQESPEFRHDPLKDKERTAQVLGDTVERLWAGEVLQRERKFRAPQHTLRGGFLARYKQRRIKEGPGLPPRAMPSMRRSSHEMLPKNHIVSARGLHRPAAVRPRGRQADPCVTRRRVITSRQ